MYLTRRGYIALIALVFLIGFAASLALFTLTGWQ